MLHAAAPPGRFDYNHAVMLHITNGGSAVALMREAGLEGEFLSWDDALHDGPAPGGKSLPEFSEVRAQFVAGCGWVEPLEALTRFRRRDRTLIECGEHEEVVLWFERDLYDQLQLIQLLDWFAASPGRSDRLSLVQSHEFLGHLRPSDFAPLQQTRQSVTHQHLGAAREAWAAFTSPDPSSLENQARRDSPLLPYLKSALRRHLQEFPSATNGLSRTERQMLSAAAGGSVPTIKLFRSCQQMESDPFMGDWSFWLRLEPLVNARQPLLELTSGNPFKRPPKVSVGELRSQELKLTETGHRVLQGEEDWIELEGIDRWLGGAHLTTERHWRWDESSDRLILRSAQL